MDEHFIREANVMTLKCTHQVIGPYWRKAMRLLPTIAVLTAVAVMPPSMVFAQNKAAKTDNAAARASRAETRASINDSYNRCVSLARSRGYTDSDLDGNRASARNFVIRCMQGKQH
jgi:hypothetical protein